MGCEKKIRYAIGMLKGFDRSLITVDFSKCSDKVLKTVEAFKEVIKNVILIHAVDYGKANKIEENIKKRQKIKD